MSAARTVFRGALSYIAVGLSCVVLTALYYEQKPRGPDDSTVSVGLSLLDEGSGDGHAPPASHGLATADLDGPTRIEATAETETATETEDSEEHGVTADPLGSLSRLEWARLRIPGKVERLVNDGRFNPTDVLLKEQDAAKLQQLVDDALLTVRPKQKQHTAMTLKLLMEHARSGQALDVTEPAALKNYNSQLEASGKPRDEELGFVFIAEKSYIPRIRWGDDVAFDSLRTDILTLKQQLTHSIRSFFLEQGRPR